jgi:hypothetical protein
MSQSVATRLLADLRGVGIDLEPVGEVLRFRPRSAMTPALLERVRANKAELLDLLAARDPGALGAGPRPTLDRCRSCGERDFVRSRSGGTWRCARCHPLPSGTITEWWPAVGESCDFGEVPK